MIELDIEKKDEKSATVKAILKDPQNDEGYLENHIPSSIKEMIVNGMKSVTKSMWQISIIVTFC